LATSALLFCIVLCSAAALWFGTYERSETVPGILIFNKGVAPITATRSGVISRIAVHEGQVVQRGNLLLEVRSEEDSRGISPVSDQIQDSLQRQDQQLQEQIEYLRQASASDTARVEEEISAQSAQLAELNGRAASQTRLVELARREFDANASVHARGFASTRYLENKEAALIERQQTLLQIEAERSAKQASFAVLRRAATNALLQGRATISGLEAQRAQLRQQMASTSASAGYAIRAPVDGVVTALAQREGQSVIPNQQLGMVRPANDQLVVRLYIPGSAVGFIGVGQSVRISVEAFPSDRFGAIPGVVTEVSDAPVTITSVNGESSSTFLATVSLDRAHVSAFGRRRPLLSGMAVAGRVTTGRENLIEWLFRPLFALSRR
jgi:membrane fusion protein